MDEKDLQELLKYPILPYPHQGSEREYPEFKKYGKLWEIAQHDNSARDHIRSYNEFVRELKKFIGRQ